MIIKKNPMGIRIDDFELWAYRRMLKTSWTKKITNQEVLRRVQLKKACMLSGITNKNMAISSGTALSNLLLIIIEITRRVPVQRAVERDEIPYPYKVHDTTLHSRE